MNVHSKRKNTMDAGSGDITPKRVKKECSYGETCYRKNPAHFREYSHPHLEAILDARTEDGDYPIPERLHLQRHMILEQIEMIAEKQLYQPRHAANAQGSSSSSNNQESARNKYDDTSIIPNASAVVSNQENESQNVGENNLALKTEERCIPLKPKPSTSKPKDAADLKHEQSTPNNSEIHQTITVILKPKGCTSKVNERMRTTSGQGTGIKPKDPDYRPLVPPTRRAEDFLKVVRPRGRMARKHAASAPYHVFYTTITDARETHSQPLSITFQEILDSSLGELKCSLQINFMVELGWLLAQYYFAGYSEKKLTILYGEDSPDLRTINQKKPHVDAHYVSMATPFGKHHTKMMLLCYEDGSLRVVISTANLYYDDWENRTQGLWFSPACPELPPDAMPHDGESPTAFKKSLLRYLNHYHMPQLSYYVERVKRCDFSAINAFLVASVPGSHFDLDWGMCRAGALLRQHCCVPPAEQRLWTLVAQASSIGSYGKEPKLWLTGDFLHNFSKIKNQSQLLSSPPELKVIYPSLENVRQSHDGLLGGGCLPYAADAHARQPWLNQFLHQWKATSTNRNKAMPHIKSYTRISKDAKKAAFYLLTSANVSKAAWGVQNKGNGALRIMSYEAGVLLLPRFVIKEDLFSLEREHSNPLVIPYDLPPVKYTEDMSAWVSDYLR